jgi:hypothetical protein
VTSGARYGRRSRSVLERDDQGDPFVQPLCPDGREEAQFAWPRVLRAPTRRDLETTSRLAEAERLFAIADRGFAGVEVDLIDVTTPPSGGAAARGLPIIDLDEDGSPSRPVPRR